MVFAAQSSHFQMWTSVPQIAVLRMRIITSLCPISGFLTRVSVKPGAGSSFDSAFIEKTANELSSAHTERFADFRERSSCAIDLLIGMRRAHLRSYARFAFWHDRIRETNDVDAFC